MYLQIYRVIVNIIEIFNPNKTNVIVGCIYRHPHIDLNEFNDYYLNNLLDKLSKENKTVFLLGDFNIDLLNYNQHSLPQFFIARNIFLNPPSTKLNIFKRDWPKFDQENFILDYLSVD